MPQHIDKDSLAILGLGKVGTALGYLLRSAGYKIVAVADRLPENLRRGVTYTGGRTFSDVAEAASLASCILIATNDDDIAPVCEEISRRGAVTAGKKVIHLSGAGSLDLLDAARRTGAFVASIHPLQSFATVEGAIKSIPGSTFGITADAPLKDWSIGLVRDLGGHPFFVAEGNKPLYHAAACLASNYLTTLMHAVEQIYLSLGIGEKEALHAFWPLVQGTLINIETNGTVQALTGPIARGDAETIARHLAAFQKRLPQLLPLYCVLGLQTVELGLAGKTLTPAKAATIIALLKGGSAHD